MTRSRCPRTSASVTRWPKPSMNRKPRRQCRIARKRSQPRSRPSLRSHPYPSREDGKKVLGSLPGWPDYSFLRPMLVAARNGAARQEHARSLTAVAVALSAGVVPATQRKLRPARRLHGRSSRASDAARRPQAKILPASRRKLVRKNERIPGLTNDRRHAIRNRMTVASKRAMRPGAMAERPGPNAVAVVEDAADGARKTVPPLHRPAMDRRLLSLRLTGRKRLCRHRWATRTMPEPPGPRRKSRSSSR